MAKKKKNRKKKRCNGTFCQIEEIKEPFKRSMPYTASANNWYKIAGRAAEKGVTEKDVSSDELKMGIKIELEHTDSKQEAKRVALDHLAELPDYYTRLKKMEQEGKKDLEK